MQFNLIFMLTVGTQGGIVLTTTSKNGWITVNKVDYIIKKRS